MPSRLYNILLLSTRVVLVVLVVRMKVPSDSTALWVLRSIALLVALRVAADTSPLTMVHCPGRPDIGSKGS